MADKHTIPCELLWTRPTDGSQIWGHRYEGDGSVSINRYDTSGNLAQRVMQITAAGLVRLSGSAPNYSTASQAGFAADTYVTGSSVAIPFGVGLVPGTRYRCTFSVTKTAAGTAAATYTVRIGTAGAIGDTSRLAFTADVAQTAAIASGIITVEFVVRTQAAAGVIAGGVGVATSSVGLGGGATAVSAGFDNTAATLTSTSFIGLSMNGGASAAWTVNHVFAEIIAP